LQLGIVALLFLFRKPPSRSNRDAGFRDTKSTYNLDFLGLREKELEDRILDLIQAFMLELGCSQLKEQIEVVKQEFSREGKK